MRFRPVLATGIGRCIPHSFLPGTRCVLHGLLVLVLTGVSPASVAQLLDLSPFAVLDASYDDNVFRSETAADLAASRADGQSRLGDARLAATVGLTGEFAPGLQAINVTGAVTRARYQHYRELDHTAYDLDGRWNWQIGRRFDGLLQASLARSLDDFRNRNSTDPTFTLDRRFEASGGYNLSPRWRGETTVVLSERVGSSSADAAFDLEERRLEFAGYYRRLPVSQLGLALTYIDGAYPKRSAESAPGLATDFEQWTGEVRGRWTPSGLSSLDAAVGVTRREQTPADGRDFTGLTGRLDYRREISGRTQVMARGYRRVWSTDQVDANFATDSGLEGQLRWRWSVKTEFVLDAEYREIRYQNETQVASVAALRADDVRSGGLTVRWQPLERLVVQLSGQREVRASNQEDADYAAWVSGLQIRLGF